jgi:hypothetical protein
LTIVAFCSAKVALKDAAFAERLTFFGHTEKHVFCLQQLVEAFDIRRLHFPALHFSAIEFGKPTTKKW